MPANLLEAAVSLTDLAIFLAVGAIEAMFSGDLGYSGK
jgi:hypothetical protein